MEGTGLMNRTEGIKEWKDGMGEAKGSNEKTEGIGLRNGRDWIDE
jgi:hypothetical protein